MAEICSRIPKELAVLFQCASTLSSIMSKDWPFKYYPFKNVHWKIHPDDYCWESEPMGSTAEIKNNHGYYCPDDSWCLDCCSMSAGEDD